MARTPERPEGAREEMIRVRVTDDEMVVIDRAAVERGMDRSELVRSIVPLLAERDMLIRAVLAPARGRLAPGEIKLILDVQNGTHLLSELGEPELAGAMITPNVADGIALDGLDQKWGVSRDNILGVLREMSRAELAGLALWTADLWRRYTDEALWEREIGWLAVDPRTNAEIAADVEAAAAGVIGRDRVDEILGREAEDESNE